MNREEPLTDSRDYCLMCPTEIPPGPDFCSPECEAKALPTVEDIRALLAGKQYFDNDYSPADWNAAREHALSFLRCACNRSDCPRCGESRRAL